MKPFARKAPRRHPAGLLVLLAGLGLLGGCASRGVPATQGRVVINYWEKWSGFEADAMRAVVDDFNRSQNRIEVRFFSISPIDLKLLLAASSGHPPDVAGLWSFSIPDFAEKGALTPLDDALAEAKLGADHFVPVFWNLCRYRGFTWGLPTTPGCVALFYNKRLFRQAGLDPDRPPRTFAELEAMSRHLTRVELVRDGRREQVPFDELSPGERAAKKYAIVQIGHLPFDDGLIYPSAWGYWFGAKLYDGAGHIQADDPGDLAAFRWFRDTVQTYGLENLRDFGSSYGLSQTARSPFRAGKEAMVVQGPWLVNFIQKYAPDLEWGVAPVPPGPGVSDPAPLTLVESDVVVIPRGARHPRAAFEFIRYLQRQDVAEKLATLQRKFTALRDVSPGFLAHHPNPAIGLFVQLARSPAARYLPRLSIWREYDDEMSVAADRVRNLLASPHDALGEVQQRVQWRLDRVRRRWAIVGPGRLAEWRDHERW